MQFTPLTIPSLAFVFPGQGSQTTEMLKDCQDHPIVLDLFAQAQHVLGYDLGEIIRSGSSDLLNQTNITQPALLTASIALYRLWCAHTQQRPRLVAGHSLGEYTALVAAGVLDYATAVKLVSLRGQYMQEAVPANIGAMAAILGLTDQQVIDLCHTCAEGEVLEAVNFNSPGQVVIAGHKNAVDRACIEAKIQGAKRTLPLNVSAPSHCRLMQPAAERLAKILDDITLQTPDMTIIHNVDAQTHTTPKAIQTALVTQLYRPVLWTQSMLTLPEYGITHVIECGPNKILTGLIKRITPDLTLFNLNNNAAIPAIASTLMVLDSSIKK